MRKWSQLCLQGGNTVSQIRSIATSTATLKLTDSVERAQTKIKSMLIVAKTVLALNNL